MSEYYDEITREYRDALDRAEIEMHDKINKAIREFFDKERAIFREFEVNTSDENTPDENTPRGTKVYVRNYDDEEWQEAYYSDFMANCPNSPYAVYFNYGDGRPCKREKADRVLCFAYCKLA